MKRVLPFLLAAGLIPVGARALGAAPALPTDRFVYSTSGSSIVDALNTLSAAEHVPVQISGDVQGRVVGRFDLTPQQFLDTMASSYDLVWYYDGVAIQVEPARALRSVTIQLNYTSAEALRALLEREGINDPRFALHVDEQRNTISASGPTRYLARIEEAAHHVENRALGSIATVVRTVKLKVAVAADRTATVDGKTVTTPGVATRLMQRRQGDTQNRQGGNGQMETDAALPAYEADPRTNSVLVRDRPERIEGDELLVQAFDSKPDMVAITAYVIDIDSDAFDALGFGEPPATQGHAWQPGWLVTSDAGRALLASIGALRHDGRAHVRIEQTVSTFDRAPAVIDRHEATLIESARVPHDAVQEEQGSAAAPAEPPPGPAQNLTLDVTPSVSDPGGARIELLAQVSDNGPVVPDARRGKQAAQAAAEGQWGDVRATLTRGECLVVVNPPARAARVPTSRRIVLLVPGVLT